MSALDLSVLFQCNIREPDGRRGPESDAGASVRDRNEPDGHGIALKKQRKLWDRLLALALGEGDTLNEFALRQGVSVGTARIQLKAVMAKTSTRRQSELVALLGRLSRSNAKW